MGLEQVILLIVIGCILPATPLRIQKYTMFLLPFLTVYIGMPTECIVNVSDLCLTAEVSVEF